MEQLQIVPSEYPTSDYFADDAVSDSDDGCNGAQYVLFPELQVLGEQVEIVLPVPFALATPNKNMTTISTLKLYLLSHQDIFKSSSPFVFDLFFEASPGQQPFKCIKAKITFILQLASL